VRAFEKTKEKDSQTAPTMADKPPHAGQDLGKTVFAHGREAGDKRD
jgi:hypothetical protein